MKKLVQHDPAVVPREVEWLFRQKAERRKQSLNQVILGQLAMGRGGADVSDLVVQWTPDPGFDETWLRNVNRPAPIDAANNVILSAITRRMSLRIHWLLLRSGHSDKRWRPKTATSLLPITVAIMWPLERAGGRWNGPPAVILG